MGFDMLNLPDDWQKCRIREIGDAVTGRTPSTKCEEIAKPGNDFNISPSPYIHTGAGEEYRPVAEIVEEVDSIEEEAKRTGAALRPILEKLGA